MLNGNEKSTRAPVEPTDMPCSTTFEFHDPGELIDGELQLCLVETRPAIPEKGIVPEYKFEMRSRGEKAGDISLRTHLTDQLSRYGGHIGYEVAAEFRGHRLAARSCRLLFELARKHGIDQLLITCAPDNMASRRTIELIGGRLQTIGRATTEEGRERDTCYYHVDLV